MNIGAYLPAAIITITIGYAVTGFGLQTAATIAASVLALVTLAAGGTALRAK